MDLYALGRMTKSYNKNIIVLVGMNHIFQYRTFSLNMVVGNRFGILNKLIKM